MHGTRESLVSVCLRLKCNQLTITHKKIQMIALQWGQEARLRFMAELSGFNPDMFIWVDETGSDSIRSYGYALNQGYEASVSPCKCGWEACLVFQ